MHLEWRRPGACRQALVVLAVLAVAALASGGAQAQDEDRAQADFVRPAAAAQRSGPPDPLDWERRLREPARFGPPPLRQADAALLAAARQSRWADAMALLKSGQASANAQDAAGGHALVLAAGAGQDELVRELIKRGAELDRSGDAGFTALGAAAFHGRRSTVRLLLRAGADVQRWGASGQTALHLASLAGQLDTLDDMLRLKVPTELLNRQRESALDVAASAGQLAVMARLIEAGADTRLAGQR